MLYQIIIYPIELIIEISYFVIQKFLYSPGLSIIGVSLIVQILSLPLYNIAEKWQNKERETQKRFKPKIDKIKAVFKGDEQYMILSTYYRQEHYHPIFALRSSVSLIIQVPFFIAAYHFLSNLEILKGTSFFLINDLGFSDALFSIGGFSINILPICMTLINIIAGEIYTRGFPLKEKLQLYGMAALFLALLYNSPAGLTLYWTLNNIFSLVKNIIKKTKKPAFLFYAGASLCIVFAALYTVFFTDKHAAKKFIISSIAAFILLIPFFMRLLRWIRNKYLFRFAVTPKVQGRLFFLSSAGVFLLAGLFIPSSLVVSSAQEFSFIDSFTSPLQLLQFPFLHAAGFFLFWPWAIYLLFSPATKTILTYIISLIFITALCNTFILIGDYGMISANLRFEIMLAGMPQFKTLLTDILIFLSAALAVLIILRYLSFKIIIPAFGLFTISLLFISVYNYHKIDTVYKNFAKQISETLENTAHTIEPIFNLSKTKQNVIVIMLDRAISSFIPEIFAELPKTAKQFEGFVFYSNTLSFGPNTLIGAPPLFGGYEYRPEEINKRSDEALVIKHNEALSLMPRLFLENGFSSVITDASWANYSWTPDNRIFKPWPKIQAKNLAGKYTALWAKKQNITFRKQSTILKRDLIFFSFFRIFPASLRGGLYDDGRWWNSDFPDLALESFTNFYSILDYLPELTAATAEDPSFICMVNEITHNPLFLQYPDYEPAEKINNIGKDWPNSTQHKSYHVNAAAIKKLGSWFDFLRSNDAYNNSRIIIVSDHGWSENFPAFNHFAIQNFYPASFNALLMVKDFYADFPVKTDETFMTNADVPFLACENIIKNPKNPFTQKEISIEAKKQGINIYDTSRYAPEDHKTNTFILDESWHVKDNLFNPKNWSKIQ